jgi:nitroreductase
VQPDRIPYVLPARSEDRMRERADALLALMRTRRSCRSFSDEPVPRTLIQRLIEVANTAPSGANRQPWRFVAIDDPGVKREIRAAVEATERKNYGQRMSEEWLEALKPLGTDPSKPYLEVAPWLIVVFRVDSQERDGRLLKSYYPTESAALATGFFLAACHQVGLATLTHTPSPMGFLRRILRRSRREKPVFLIPVGYPARDCTVPDIEKLNTAQVLQWNR